MKLQLLRARLALLTGRPEVALATSTALAATARIQGVPRYASTAALVGHQARAALGEPVDLERARADLAEVESAVRLEAWWWAGETGAALGDDHWIRHAEQLAAQLAEHSGTHRDTLRVEAGRRLAGWRLRTR